MTLRLILFGAPGSGKGTQGPFLADRFSIPQVSTGEILRENVRNGTDLGVVAEGYMSAGDLVPDDVIVNMVRERIAQSDARDGFILDGFPRNVPQAKVLDAMLDRLKQPPVSRAVHLAVADEEIVGRLLMRAKKEGRADDKEDVIRHRIEVYNGETKPLLNFYAHQHKLVEVHGIGTLEEIFDRIIDAL